MKKLFQFKSLVFIAVLIFSASCTQNLELYNAKALDYSGRFFVRSVEENGTVVHQINDSDEIQIYSTSADVVGEVWLDDHTNHHFTLRQKISLTGNPEDFASKSVAFTDLTDNVKRTDISTVSAIPKAVGEMQSFNYPIVRAAVIEGKIIKDGSTIKHLAVQQLEDSIYIKLQLYGGTVRFESYELPVNLRPDPAVAAYSWKLQAVERNPALDRVLTLSGHRVTGFE